MSVHFFIERQPVQSYLCICRSHRVTRVIVIIFSLYKSPVTMPIELLVCMCLALEMSECVQTTNLKMSQLPHAYMHFSWWTKERRTNNSLFFFFFFCFFFSCKGDYQFVSMQSSITVVVFLYSLMNVWRWSSP